MYRWRETELTEMNASQGVKGSGEAVDPAEVNIIGEEGEGFESRR